MLKVLIQHRNPYTMMDITEASMVEVDALPEGLQKTA
jgi:hypothetical protein